MGAGRGSRRVATVLSLPILFRAMLLTTSPGATPPGGVGAGDGSGESSGNCPVPDCNGTLYRVQRFLHCTLDASHVVPVKKEPA